MLNNRLSVISMVLLVVLSLFPPQALQTTVKAASTPDNPFHMQDGLLTVEVESTPVVGDWAIGTALSGASGSYYHWDFAGNVNQDKTKGVLEYFVNVPQAGRYRFQLRSARGPINDNTEENDVWVRITGQGSRAIGIKTSSGAQVTMGNDWFKLYQNQSGQEWTWASRHVDNNAHEIYMEFDGPGVYVVGFSGRSAKFNIDRWVLYDETQYSQAEATDLSNAPSPQQPVDETPTPTTTSTAEPTNSPTPTSTPTSEPATTTPTPTASPEATTEPTSTPSVEPPTTPATLTVDPNNGRPLILWPEDAQAQWFNVWIVGRQGNTILADAWFPIPGAPWGDTVLTKVNCQNGTCTLAPNVDPTGGTYDVWIRSWADGVFSTGGNSQYEGWSTTSFSLPATRPDAPANFAATIANSRPTLTWTGQPWVTWYQIWIGTVGTLEERHFEVWTPGSAFGCATPGTCTFSPQLTLPGGNYVVWMQTWGPGGFNVSDLDNGWVEVGTFDVP